MEASSYLLQRAGPAMEPLIVFDILTAIAFVILMLSISVAWFSNVPRLKTWYLLQLTTAGYCVSFLFLVGHQVGPEPPLHLCAYSAALIYAAPPGVAAAGLFFVVELHLRMSSALFSRSMSDKFIYWVAWGIPLCHGVAFWTALTIGLADAKNIKRDPSGVYCHIVGSKVPTLLTGSLVIILLAAMLIMEGVTIFHLLRQRETVRAMRVRGSEFPLHLFVRTVLYTVAGGAGMIGADVLMNARSATWTIILMALIPLSVALVFGTQKQILVALFCCRSRRKGAAWSLKSASSPV